MKDSADMFKEPDRGRFGDNERQSRPLGARDDAVKIMPWPLPLQAEIAVEAVPDDESRTNVVSIGARA